MKNKPKMNFSNLRQNLILLKIKKKKISILKKSFISNNKIQKNKE
jgi:hypothetical protein